MVAPAAIPDQSVSFWPTKANIPTLKVRSSGRLKVKTRGIKKLFQEPKKVNKVTVAIIGTDSGSIIRQKIATKPAPSSNAASSSSLGIRLKKPVKSRIEVV